MEEGGPSFGKFFFLEIRRHVIASKYIKKKKKKKKARDCFFLKSEKGHIGVIPHHHTIIGTKGEMQGR